MPLRPRIPHLTILSSGNIRISFLIRTTVRPRFAAGFASRQWNRETRKQQVAMIA